MGTVEKASVIIFSLVLKISTRVTKHMERLFKQRFRSKKVLGHLRMVIPEAWR